MNKTELVSAVAGKSGLSKKSAGDAVDALIEVVTGELAKGGKVQLIGFGSFEVRERAARQGKNPATGAAISIPASKSPVFKAGKPLKDAVGK